MFSSSSWPSVGIIGFGSFGQLVARHLAPHLDMCAFDPVWPTKEADGRVRRGDLGAAARCDVVVLAVPVSRLAAVAAEIAPHLAPHTLVLDVGSVKVEPAAVLARSLPTHAEILATHPLFGPQSAGGGLAGHKIVLCPVRGRRWLPLARFLQHGLGLTVIITTPEAHDRELATVQGLTHMVGRLLAEMGPLPTQLTTRSFDLLREAAAMVAGDAPEVFDAILRSNAHAESVQRRFFGAVARLEAALTLPGGPDGEALTPSSPCSAMVRPWSSAPASVPSWCP